MKNIKIILLTVSVILLVLNVGCTLESSKALDTDVPDEYMPTITMLKQLVDYRLAEDFEERYNNGEIIPSPNPELEYEWHCMIVEADERLDKTEELSFGYAIMDVNADGVKELLFYRHDNFLLAIFTIKDENAYLLSAFWPKHSAIILSSGDILIKSSSGAQDFEYTINEIDVMENSVLQKKLTFGCSEGNFFKSMDSNYTVISFEDFTELTRRYSDSSIVLPDDLPKSVVQENF